MPIPLSGIITVRVHLSLSHAVVPRPWTRVLTGINCTGALGTGPTDVLLPLFCTLVARMLLLLRRLVLCPLYMRLRLRLRLELELQLSLELLLEGRQPAP